MIARRQSVMHPRLPAVPRSPCPRSACRACEHARGAGRGRTDGGSLIEVGGGELRGGVDAGPAPEHDALQTSVAVQALLRLLIRLLVVAVLRLGALRLVDGQVAACITSSVIGAVKFITVRVMRRRPPDRLHCACSGKWQTMLRQEFPSLCAQVRTAEQASI